MPGPPSPPALGSQCPAEEAARPHVCPAHVSSQKRRPATSHLQAVQSARPPLSSPLALSCALLPVPRPLQDPSSREGRAVCWGQSEPQAPRNQEGSGVLRRTLQELVRAPGCGWPGTGTPDRARQGEGVDEPRRHICGLNENLMFNIEESFLLKLFDLRHLLYTWRRYT